MGDSNWQCGKVDTGCNFCKNHFWGSGFVTVSEIGLLILVFNPIFEFVDACPIPLAHDNTAIAPNATILRYHSEKALGEQQPY
jgi:hypothetical protein